MLLFLNTCFLIFIEIFCYIAFFPCFWFCIFAGLLFSVCFHLWVCILHWLLPSFDSSFCYFFYSLSLCECDYVSFLVCFCLFRFILPYVLEFYLSVLFLLVCWFDFFFLFLSFPFSSMMCGLWSLGSPPGGRPEPLNWETQIQDVGQPEISSPRGMFISENFPKGLRLNTKIWPHTKAIRL